MGRTQRDPLESKYKATSMRINNVAQKKMQNKKQIRKHKGEIKRDVTSLCMCTVTNPSQ